MLSHISEASPVSLRSMIVNHSKVIKAIEVSGKFSHPNLAFDSELLCSAPSDFLVGKKSVHGGGKGQKVNTPSVLMSESSVLEDVLGLELTDCSFSRIKTVSANSAQIRAYIFD